MTIKDWIKNKVLKFLGLEKISASPNDVRLTFISDDEKVKIDEIRANRVWYIGNGDELLNFYTQKQAIGFNDNPIYNRNKRNYFWSLSAEECNIKRIHSGIPYAIVSTLSNAIGLPQIDEPTGLWDKIAEENDFNTKLIQQARTLTAVEGYGAWKPNFNKTLSSYPLWEFYEAENVEYIVKCGLIVGVIFKSYYKKNKDNYVLLETRYRAKGNSYVEYNLFKVKKSDDLEEVAYNEVPELSGLENLVIPGYNELLAVPSRYFYDPLNAKYGRSIYAGKLDLFDMLDEVLSQASQTNRVSTPVEYYSPDVLERGKNGAIGVPNLYNRQFIQKAGIPDGEGNLNNDIVTTQPDLNFDKYGGLAKDILDYILTGILSPATMGIDIAKKDNADAQREKEKVTIMTRNNIISQETVILRKVVQISLDLKEYMDTGKISLIDRQVNVKYNEFANPSFENELQVLGSAWANGEISTEKYVDLLWADKLTDEEKAAEVQWLDSNKQSDMEGALGPDVSEFNEGLQREPQAEEEPDDNASGMLQNNPQ